MSKLLPRILFAIGFLLLIFPSGVQAASVIDQYEYVPLPPNTEAGFWYIKSHTVKQTFKPTKNKLDKVYVFLNGNGSSATITMAIKDAAANSIGSMSATAPSSTYGGWVLFDFSTDLSVTTEAVYQIILTTTSTTAYWRIDKVPEYTRGDAVVDGIVKNTAPTIQDFGFRTYAYDEAAPPPSPSPAPPPAEESAPADEQTNTTPVANQNTTDEKSQNTAATVALETKGSTKSATPSSKEETKKEGFSLFSPIVLVPLVVLVFLAAVLITWFLAKRKPKQTLNPEKRTPTDSPPPQPGEEKKEPPTS